MSTAATSAAVFRVPVASWRIIALFLVAQAVLVPLLLLYRRQILVPIAQATGWWVAPDLAAGAILIAVCVGGVLVWLGGFRARDVGVRASDLPAARSVAATGNGSGRRRSSPRRPSPCCTSPTGCCWAR